MVLFLLLAVAEIQATERSIVLDGQPLPSGIPKRIETDEGPVLLADTAVEGLRGPVTVKLPGDRSIVLQLGVRLMVADGGYRLVRHSKGRIYVSELGTTGDQDVRFFALPSPVFFTLSTKGFVFGRRGALTAPSLKAALFVPGVGGDTDIENRGSEEGADTDKQTTRQAGAGVVAAGGDATIDSVFSDDPGPQTNAGGAGPATVGPSPPILSDAGF
ncbi:MAG: hypothetical protein HYV07_01770 [Deltaproteobacteria bacterium]|nr:hypothetical protein [Deltaproteobacteria bacterium]